ncbi:hypothetical protein ACFFHK_04845 [Gallibacterium trehalosifermentans]|uniref:DNA gyrase subunit B n=1 Tax=Gallibacterium trehalosifermentans TaxID=516935 RepID=A0ABV6H0A2_9PAST
MKKVITVLFTIIFILYPLFIYVASHYIKLQWLIWGVLCVFIFRGVMLIASTVKIKTNNPEHSPNLSMQQQAATLKGIGIYSAFIGVALAIGALVFDSQQALLFYPVFINVLLFTVFFTSLFRPITMIEYFARLQKPALPVKAIRYTRKVTQVWCLFFVLNGSVAFYTALFADLSLWTLYNGVISYILMATLFVTEWLIRHFWLTKRV